jgi:cbb3-type cytochrome oxidase subunit 3
MTRLLVGIAVGIIFLMWLVIMLPGWIMGMMFMGQVRIAPTGPMDAGFWIFVAMMYVPPILAAATVYWLLKTRRKNRMIEAADADAANHPGAAA